MYPGKEGFIAINEEAAVHTKEELYPEDFSFRNFK